MNPATGRRWSRVSQVLDDLYIHRLPVAAEAWLAWAASESFLLPLRHRMANVGVASKTVERLVHAALSPAQWRPLAALDAAVRMVDALVSCGGLRRGRQAEGALLALLERARNAADATTCIPDAYWSVRPAPESLEGDAQVMLRGAVLAYRALEKASLSLVHLADAGIAWKQIAPLFHAAARTESLGAPAGLAQPQATVQGEALLEGHDLVFRYGERSEAVLRGCDIRINVGDHALL